MCVARFVEHRPDRMNVIRTKLVVDACTYITVESNGREVPLVLRNKRLIPLRKTNRSEIETVIFRVLSVDANEPVVTVLDIQHGRCVERVHIVDCELA